MCLIENTSVIDLEIYKTSPILIAEPSSSFFHCMYRILDIYNFADLYSILHQHLFFTTSAFLLLYKDYNSLYKKSMDGCWTSAQKPKEKVKHQLDRYSKTHWEMFMIFTLLDLKQNK